MSKIIPRDIPCYCIKFRRASNILTKYYDKIFEPYNVTANQFSLLVSISILKSCNKSELAQFARLDRTTIVRSISILLEKDFIEEVLNQNKKFKEIQLTKKGETVLSEGKEKWQHAQNKVKSTIGEENIITLKQILESIDSLESLLDL